MFLNSSAADFLYVVKGLVKMECERNKVIFYEGKEYKTHTVKLTFNPLNATLTDDSNI